MDNKKDRAIEFSITLVPAGRTPDAKMDLEKKRLTIRRQNAMLGKTRQAATHDVTCQHTKMPPQGKPFTPDLFSCEPRTLPTCPPPRRMSREEDRVQKGLERFRSQTVSHPTSSKSSSMALSVPWEFFKVIFAGVFVALKYIFTAVAVIITIGCMICAGRQTGGLR